MGNFSPFRPKNVGHVWCVWANPPAGASKSCLNFLFQDHNLRLFYEIECSKPHTYHSENKYSKRTGMKYVLNDINLICKILLLQDEIKNVLNHIFWLFLERIYKKIVLAVICQAPNLRNAKLQCQSEPRNLKKKSCLNFHFCTIFTPRGFFLAARNWRPVGNLTFPLRDHTQKTNGSYVYLNERCQVCSQLCVFTLARNFWYLFLAARKIPGKCE